MSLSLWVSSKVLSFAQLLFNDFIYNVPLSACQRYTKHNIVCIYGATCCWLRDRLLRRHPVWIWITECKECKGNSSVSAGGMNKVAGLKWQQQRRLKGIKKWRFIQCILVNLKETWFYSPKRGVVNCSLGFRSTNWAIETFPIVLRNFVAIYNLVQIFSLTPQ